MFKRFLFRFLEVSFGFSYPIIACWLPIVFCINYFNLCFLCLYFITIPLMMMQYEFYEQYDLDGVWFKIYNAIME